MVYVTIEWEYKIEYLKYSLYQNGTSEYNDNL